jgi:ABC-type nitrate/sulfonate/bicarbonate transport system ATPase subunit
MKNTVVLKVKNISRSYLDPDGKSVGILKDISFSVFENEIVSFVGPSGCGKTTLFNLISGILKPDQGEIIFTDKSRISRNHCGYMFQDHLLFPWLKSVENVMLGFEMQNEDQSTAKKKALALLSQFGLGKFSQNYPHTLSGGMKQKIALLRTVAFNSSVLLLDEPFGSLDAINRTNLHHYLITLWKKLNLTVLFITHDIREAVFLSDRIFIMDVPPSTIIREITVDLKRPRNFNVLSTLKAARIEKRILEIMKDNSPTDS